MKTLAIAFGYGVLGPAIGAIVLLVLSVALDWEVQRLGPVFTYIVIAYVAGAPALFLTGLMIGLPRNSGLGTGRRMLLSAALAGVLGAVWGIVGAQSHLDAPLWGVIAEVGGGCAIAAALCALALGAARRWRRDRTAMRRTVPR